MVSIVLAGTGIVASLTSDTGSERFDAPLPENTREVVDASSDAAEPDASLALPLPAENAGASGADTPPPTLSDW